MPRPAASGYERLAQADDSDSDSEPSNSPLNHASRITSIQPGPTSMNAPLSSSVPSKSRQNRARANSAGVDIKAINARLEKWAEEIAAKFKFKKGRHTSDEPPLEIVFSVFKAPEGFRGAVGDVEFGEDEETVGQERFEEIVESVRAAIRKGVDPTLIRQGSSGSYFARDIRGRVVGVFKPKDEEPYGKLNPKMMKWLHRTLFPCFFGRACLIPNLSYISEAAASLLDRQLRTFLVPYTDVVHLASKAFHYDYWDRRAYYRRRKPFPTKIGSFQVFLQGYEDANIFLRKHPWPDQYNSGFRTDAAPRRRPWNYTCRPGADDRDEEAELENESPSTNDDRPNRKFVWTEHLQQSFREELEKLVILDYIMRNTDRGLDNWMVHVDWDTQEATITTHPPKMKLDTTDGANSRSASPMYRVQEPMNSRSGTPQNAAKGVKLGAIDNSLSFPWKHPDQWRSFPFGWLFLPVSLVGQPFSQKTRDHFIPLLTSSAWWSETQTALRHLFELDPDFKERMYQKQLAVLKGQAFNVVETLKTPDQGPLELTRRPRVHVWDDEVEIPVTIPLRVPSSEARRHDSYRDSLDEEDEMDIGAAASSAPIPHEHDLLGLGTSPPRAKVPSIVRLGHRGNTSMDGESNVPVLEREDSPDSDLAQSPQSNLSGQSAPPMMPHAERPHNRHFTSYDTGINSRPGRNSREARRARRGSNYSIGGVGYDDGDLEGDLGYTAVDGSEGARKKVIVERLETVKTRNPVFTWC